MGLLDSLQFGGGGGLLDFLQSLQQPQQSSFSGLPSDQAQYGAAPQYAAPMLANAQMPPQQSAPQQQPMPTPAPQQQPIQPAPMQAPQQPIAAPQESAGGLGAGLSGFLGNIHTGPLGALIGGIGSAAGLQDPAVAAARQQANMTAAYLQRIGAPPEAIAAAVGNGRVAGNPEVLKTLLTKYANQEKVRPATAEERRAYGVPEGLPMSIDTSTGKPAYGPANTSISNVINGEKEQDKTLGKGYGERQLEIQKVGSTAPAALGNLNLMDKLIDDPNFYSGQGGQTATTLKRLAVSAGIANADSASPNELFQKLSQKSVLDAAGGSLGTGFSNADRDFMAGTVANLDNTKEGNKQIIEVGRQVQKRNIEIARQAREYAKAHNGRLDAGFEEQIATYAEQNPLFANVAVRPAAPPAAPAPAISRADAEAELRRRGKIK